jgi:hypothetical protein
MSSSKMKTVTSSPNHVSLWCLCLKWPTKSCFTAKKRRVVTSNAKVSKGKSTATIVTDDEVDGGDEADGESNLPKCM